MFNSLTTSVAIMVLTLSPKRQSARMSKITRDG